MLQSLLGSRWMREPAFFCREPMAEGSKLRHIKYINQFKSHTHKLTIIKINKETKKRLLACPTLQLETLVDILQLKT